MIERMRKEIWKNAKSLKMSQVFCFTHKTFVRFPGFAVVIVTFFGEILDDFHDFYHGCAHKKPNIKSSRVQSSEKEVIPSVLRTKYVAQPGCFIKGARSSSTSPSQCFLALDPLGVGFCLRLPVWASSAMPQVWFQVVGLQGFGAVGFLGFWGGRVLGGGGFWEEEGRRGGGRG